MGLKPPTGFTGFGPKLYRFFHELDENQNRDWFTAERGTYEAEVREPFVRLVNSVTLALAAHDLPLRGDPKISMFRINRDVRFSKDKRPYKTQASGVWTRDATKRAQGLLYFQIGLGGAFAAAGFYGPEPDQLHAIRTAIATRPDAWRQVEGALAAQSLPLSTAHSLTRLPRGFDPDEVAGVAHAIRCTSLVVSRPLGDGDTGGPALVDALVELATGAMPLLTFGWNALSSLPPRRPGALPLDPTKGSRP